MEVIVNFLRILGPKNIHHCNFIEIELSLTTLKLCDSHYSLYETLRYSQVQ